MSITYLNTSRNASQALNDWLCAQVSKFNSFEALENRAKDHSAYKDDAATMRVVAKVWCDYLAGKIDPRGQVTEFERRLLLRTDPRRGAAAIVLLLELRCHWRLTDKFPLSARAKHRGVVPEILRKPFDGAVDLLMQTGCIQLVRPSRYSGDGKQDAALYDLTPVRQDGELPSIELAHMRQLKKTAQAPARKPQAAETPPTSPPEAADEEYLERVADQAVEEIMKMWDSVVLEPTVEVLVKADDNELDEEPVEVEKEPEPVIAEVVKEPVRGNQLSVMPTVRSPEPIVFVAPPNAEEQAKLDWMNARNARCKLPPMTEEHIRCQLLFMRAQTDEEKAEANHQINMIAPLLAPKKVVYSTRGVI